MVRSYFDKKVVIITGGSSGLGRSLAEFFSLYGANIVITGRNSDKLEETAKALQSGNGKILTIKADIRNIRDNRNMVTSTIREFGRIDILINNAGLGMAGMFETMKPEIFKEIIEVNTLGSVYPTLLALPYLKESKGSVIFISSLAGLFGIPNSSAYSVAKMGLTALAESLTIELSGTGVHVGIIYVGFLINDSRKRVIGPDGTLLIPVKRPGYLCQSHEKAARKIIRVIKRRIHKKTISPLGFLLGLTARLSPLLLKKILSYTLRMKKIHHGTNLLTL